MSESLVAPIDFDWTPSRHLLEKSRLTSRTENNSRSSGIRIDPWRSNGTAPFLYCCGDANPLATSASSACVDGNDPFTLPNGTPIIGSAALATVEVTNSTNSHRSTPAVNNKATLGVGLGLGLGLGLVVASLLMWVVRERRQKTRLQRQWEAAEKNVEQAKDRTPTIQPYRCPDTYGGPGELLQRGWEPAVQELRGSMPATPELDGLEMRQLIDRT